MFVLAETLQDVYQAAMELPDEARLELVERLIPTIASNHEVEVEQVSVVRKRMAEMESGEVKPVPADEVFRRVRESLALRRKA